MAVKASSISSIRLRGSKRRSLFEATTNGAGTHPAGMAPVGTSAATPGTKATAGAAHTAGMAGTSPRTGGAARGFRRPALRPARRIRLGRHIRLDRLLVTALARTEHTARMADRQSGGGILYEEDLLNAANGGSREPPLPVQRGRESGFSVRGQRRSSGVMSTPAIRRNSRGATRNSHSAPAA
jgi:hypothetical protein